MVLNDKQKIKLCRKIIKNPRLLGKTNINGYNSQDLAGFISHLGDRNNNRLSIGIVEDYKRELESHINSISYKRVIIIIILTAIITNLDRIIKIIISLFNK